MLAMKSNTKANQETGVSPVVTELWQSYRQHSCVEAENRLVEHYLPLVRATVNWLQGSLPKHADLDDLYSARMIGLVGALRKFDVKCGVPFERYVRRRIHGAMQDEIRRMDWLPRAIRQKSRMVQDIVARLEQELGRVPTHHETARALRISTTVYEQWLEEIKPAQLIELDAMASDDSGLVLGNAISNPDEVSPMEQAASHELKEIILEKIKGMPQAQQRVLTLYYLEDMYLYEVAEAMGLTESRICQIHSQALATLRAQVRRHENGMDRPVTSCRQHAGRSLATA